MDDQDLRDLMKVQARKRVYASMREGGSKEQKELAVVTDWLETSERQGSAEYFDPAVATQDPPDCTVRNAQGQVVGVEVAELVSREAIEINERARPSPGKRPELKDLVQRRWDRAGFLDALAALIATKDAKTYLGGPHAELLLLVHTDEPLLKREQCETWLAGHAFPTCVQLTRAFLLYPYEPPSGYPVGELRLGGA